MDVANHTEALGGTAMSGVVSTQRGALISQQEAADYLHKPVSWLYHEARKHGIPRYKIGAQWRYRLVELDAWIDQQVAT